jgi:myo-inositol-1(or 4)-monophosphatase
MNLSSDELKKLEDQVTTILKTVGATLIAEWQQAHQVTLKALSEPVTEVDVRMENVVRRELTKLLPGAGFIVEEGEDITGTGYQWVIDPIDQTKNFIGHIPLFYSQAALVSAGEPILGAIYNPVSGQMLSASLGNGVRLNGEPLTTRVKEKLVEALVDVDFGGNSQGVDWKMPALGALARTAYRIRITGGAFAPYLATGGVDAFVALSEVTKIVDQMPRMILARELGLLFEKLIIGGHSIYLAGSKPVFDEIKVLLEETL